MSNVARGNPIHVVNPATGAPYDGSDPVPVTAIATATPDLAYEYETVAASATDQILGGGGAIGDFLSHLIIVPAVAACGAVSMKDGAGSSISLFVGGGTVPLPILAPIVVYVGLLSLNGGWKITTGADVSVIAAGNFT